MRDLPYLRPMQPMSWFDKAVPAVYLAASAFIAGYFALPALAGWQLAAALVATPAMLHLSDRFGVERRFGGRETCNLAHREQMPELLHPKVEKARARLEERLHKLGETRTLQVVDMTSWCGNMLPRVSCFLWQKETVIGFNQRAVNMLSEEEIEGCLAHEWVHALTEGHPYYRYGLRGTRTFTCIPDLIAISAGGAAIKFLGQTLFCLALQKRGEFHADHNAILLTGNPDAYASGLQKLYRAGMEDWCQGVSDKANTAARRQKIIKAIVQGRMERRYAFWHRVSQFKKGQPSVFRRLNRVEAIKRQMQRAKGTAIVPTPAG